MARNRLRVGLAALPFATALGFAGTASATTPPGDTSDAMAAAGGPEDQFRWVYVAPSGEIVAQSGGFTMVAAYPTLDNTAEAGQPDNSLRANGNVYIDAGEDLSTDAIVATLTLQNTVDVDAGGMAGRTEGPDANAEFSGEITVSVCNTGAPADATGPTNCAPPDAQNGTSFAVSPRMSDGTPTTDANRKGFYVVVLGD